MKLSTISSDRNILTNYNAIEPFRQQSKKAPSDKPKELLLFVLDLAAVSLFQNGLGCHDNNLHLSAGLFANKEFNGFLISLHNLADNAADAAYSVSGFFHNAVNVNVGNGDALRNIALMAQAIKSNVPLDELSDVQRDIMAHFKNPAMPSVAATTDAAIKIATVRPEFAQTDTFLEMIGFDKASIRKEKSEESRARGLVTLEELEELPDETNTAENLE